MTTTKADQNGQAPGRPLKELTGETYSKQWGQNFRALRLQRFDSQQSFRDALERNGVKIVDSAVSHWERGHRTPRLQDLQAIATTLRCTVDTLVPSPSQLKGKGAKRPARPGRSKAKRTEPGVAPLRRVKTKLRQARPARRKLSKKRTG